MIKTSIRMLANKIWFKVLCICLPTDVYTSIKSKIKRMKLVNKCLQTEDDLDQYTLLCGEKKTNQYICLLTEDALN